MKFHAEYQTKCLDCCALSFPLTLMRDDTKIFVCEGISCVSFFCFYCLNILNRHLCYIFCIIYVLWFEFEHRSTYLQTSFTSINNEKYVQFMGHFFFVGLTERRKKRKIIIAFLIHSLVLFFCFLFCFRKMLYIRETEKWKALVRIKWDICFCFVEYCSMEMKQDYWIVDSTLRVLSSAFGFKAFHLFLINLVMKFFDVNVKEHGRAQSSNESSMKRNNLLLNHYHKKSIYLSTWEVVNFLCREIKVDGNAMWSSHKQNNSLLWSFLSYFWLTCMSQHISYATKRPFFPIDVNHICKQSEPIADIPKRKILAGKKKKNNKIK